METKDAMKAVINASTARTENTFANTDLIQLYDNNGNPSFKISKSDFMSAVYNYLTSSSVAANLASVLGGVIYTAITDKSDEFLGSLEPGWYCYDQGTTDDIFLLYTNVKVGRISGFPTSKRGIQVKFDYQLRYIEIRNVWSVGGTFSPWKTFALS